MSSRLCDFIAGCNKILACDRQTTCGCDKKQTSMCQCSSGHSIDAARCSALAIDTAGDRAAASHVVAERCCYQSTGQTDTRTDTVPLHRRLQLEAGSANNLVNAQ